ncbi:hypothetical protein GBA65_00510 [Rubrobacter marinus]|uniref:Uracil-DNA glycosylase-like domain-containing protein n=1 Tax=Rubrobacter marinus TaxID=2653852 RepID=A0A6G8PSS2_9ACTN|nr:uracil-DNA glycosylase family protein [Rubrobacter marinus]QIN77247.1 hypothetical protein GBA65_00510 [Rubrobacter marinus]
MRYGRHPVERLFELLGTVEPYPEGVVPVPEKLPGTAFFPGGTGLWQPDGAPPPMPIGGVMVLGHDFYSEAGYRRFVAERGESTRGPTWRNLLALLARVGVGPERCFFTNAYVGLRAGSRNTGRFPGSRDPGFVERCREFLGEQLRAQKPRLVLTLGSYVPAVLAPLSGDLAPWLRAASLKALDEAGRPLIPNARFPSVPGGEVAVAALVHPSIRWASVLGRRYAGLEGDAAEVAMLEEALRVSGLREG